MMAQRNKNWNKDAKSAGKNGFCKDSKKMTRRNSTKGERRAKEIVDTAEKSQENDYSWHSKFKQFSNDAGSIQFATPLGNCLRMGTDKIYTPGVMAISFAPTIGYSADQRSPINRSADRFKTYLRSVQKASADYDAADIMIIEMAVDSLLTLHRHLIRAYKVANLYSAVNQYYPDALLISMGFNPNIKNQMSEFRGFINQLGINLTRFVMPANFDINQRHKWMVEGIYLDSNTSKAQTYLFVPAGFWKYSATTDTNGSSLVWQSTPTTGNQWTLAQWIQLATSMLNALSNDDDVNTINGDLYAAYGQAGIAPIPVVNDMDMVLPVYDPIVLSQIENATLVGGWDASYTPKITQDSAVNGKGLLFTPTFLGNSSMRFYSSPTAGADTGICVNAAVAQAGAILNMHIESPSPEAIMEATRLTVAVDTPLPKPNAVSGQFSPTIFGSDVVFAANVIYMGQTGSILTYSITTQTVPQVQFIPDGVVQNRVTDVWAYTEAFDWCPLFYQTVLDSSGYPNVLQVLGDIDNITFVPAWQLNMLHEASLLSLFEVPEFDGRLARAGER